jgi:hypothetical protein
MYDNVGGGGGENGNSDKTATKPDAKTTMKTTPTPTPTPAPMPDVACSRQHFFAQGCSSFTLGIESMPASPTCGLCRVKGRGIIRSTLPFLHLDENGGRH